MPDQPSGSCGNTRLTRGQASSPAGPSKRPVAKVVFDRAAGEVRILGRWKGESFPNTFLVERDLATTLEEAKAFIKQRTTQ